MTNRSGAKTSCPAPLLQADDPGAITDWWPGAVLVAVIVVLWLGWRDRRKR